MKRPGKLLLLVVGITLVMAAWGAVSVLPSGAQGAAKCEPEQAAVKYPHWAHKKVIIAADPAMPPYVMRSPDNFEHLYGVDADLIPIVMACSGLQYEYKLGAWGSLLPAVSSGQADVMWSNLYYTHERAQQVDFIVFERAGTGGLVRAGNPRNIKAMDDVCGKTAAAGVGTVEENTFNEQSKKCVAAGKPAINLVDYPDIPAGSRLIANGRADILLSDLGITSKLVKDSPKDFAMGFTIFTDWKVGPAIRKGNDELVQAIYNGLKVQEENGTIKKVLGKYGIPPALAIPVEIFKQ